MILQFLIPAAVAIPAAAILGSSLIQGISGLFTNKSNRDSVNATNETNLRIAEMNNQAAADLQEKNNLFNAEQSELAYNRNRDLTLELLERNQNYNSAAAQAARYAHAGINPFVAFKNGGSASVIGSSASAAPSASSAPLPQFQAPTLTPAQIQNPFANISLARDIADVVKTLSETRKNDADTKSTLDKLSAELTGLFANAHLSEAKAQHEEIMAGINQAMLPKKLATEIQKDIADIELKAAQGNLADADAALKIMQERLANTQNQNLKAQAPFLIKQLEEQIALLQEQQKTEKSKQTLNNATAEEATTRANLNREQIQIVKSQQGYWEDLAYSQHLDTMIKDANWYKEFKANETKLLREHVITEQTYTALESAIQAKDWFLFSTICNSIAQLGNAGANIYGASKAGKVTSVTEHTHYHGDSYIDSYHYDGR